MSTEHLWNDADKDTTIYSE